MAIKNLFALAVLGLFPAFSFADTSRIDFTLNSNNSIALSGVKTPQFEITTTRGAICAIEIRFPEMGISSQLLFNSLAEKISIKASKQVAPVIKEAVVVYEIPSDMEYFGLSIKTKSGENISDSLPAQLHLDTQAARELYDIMIVAKMCN